MTTVTTATRSSGVDADLQPRTITIPEWSSVPVTLDRAMAARLQHEAKDWLKVEPDWEPGRYWLTTTRFVGVMRVGELTIRLEPKTPAPNLFEMITWAWNLPHLRKESASFAQADNLFEFVAAVFVGEVENLLRKGIYRAYRAEDESFPFLRGRLDVARQIRSALRSPGRFEQTLHEYTADVTENRILAWTLHKLARAPWHAPFLPARIRRAVHVLSDVALLPVADSSFDRLVYTRLNESYRSPLALARLLLRLLSLESHAGDTLFRGWLLNMDELFEQFVANYLAYHMGESRTQRRGFTAGPTAVERTMRSLDIVAQQTFFLEVGSSEWIQPDLLLRRNGAPIAVLDTKHKFLKGTPKPEDRRQILEYANRLRISEGMLLYSAGSPQAHLHRYDGTLPLRLRTRVWSLDGDLNAFRARNGHMVTELVQTYALSAPLAA